MESKIMIDVDDQGMSTVKVTMKKDFMGFDSNPYDDVRDKLVKRFLEGGCFALISYEGDFSEVAQIHSMGPIDVMTNILNMFGSCFKSDSDYKVFEQSVYQVSSLLETLGFSSKEFSSKCSSQAGVPDGSFDVDKS